MPKENSFLIGDLARRAGVHRETLRYYERLGLLRPARRTQSGYRVYDRAAADRLRFIKRAQGFGFSLEEIGDLLGLRPESARSCSRVLTMLDGKLFELGEQIAAMKRFYRQLSRYREQCRQALRLGEACPLILDVSRSPKSGKR